MSDTSTPAVDEPPPSGEPHPGRLAGVSAFQYLMLTACIGALGLLAARGLLRSRPAALASTDYRQATAEVQDTLEVLRKAMLTGQEVPAKNGTSVSVTTPFPGPFRVLRVERRVEDALVSKVSVAGSFRPAPRAELSTPDDLPRFSPETVEALLADPGLVVRRVREDTLLTDKFLGGLIVVSPGVRLTLRNVVLQGAVVSETALSQEALTRFDGTRAPTVIIEGVLRTEPMSRLHGVSLVLPDGIVRTADDTASLSLHGAVIAHDLSLQGRGSLFGQVVTLTDAKIAPSVERIGHGRVPQAWPDCLETRESLRTDFIAYLPANDTWGDVQPMIGYRFP